MKRLLPILLSVLAITLQASATNVSGVISGTTTWTKANSPYIVTAHTVVDEGATLFIEPGVEVLVDPNVDFFVDGSLRAIGTVTDPILFKSNLANTNRKSWRGINSRSDGAADSTVFNYCHFTSAETPVYAYNGDIVIVDHCQFTECWAAITAICYHGFYVGNSTIKHCDKGIGTGGTGTIENNEIGHVNAWGIYTGNALVANNYVHDAQEGGIHFSAAPGVYSELRNNKVVNCGKGFSVKGKCTDGVHHNLSAYNNFGYTVGDYEGNINNNTALHNKTGVHISSPIAVFKNNCIDSCTDYLLQTGSWVDKIDVSGNYWGTTDSATLYTSSLEFYDDFHLPKAVMLPALQPADGNCQHYTGPVVTKIPDTKTASAEVVVSPNPFTDRFSITLQGKTGKLEVFNMAGQKLISIDATNRNKMEVDMSAYPAGVYHYRVAFTDQTIATGKLVKQ